MIFHRNLRSGVAGILFAVIVAALCLPQNSLAQDTPASEIEAARAEMNAKFDRLAAEAARREQAQEAVDLSDPGKFGTIIMSHDQRLADLENPRPGAISGLQINMNSIWMVVCGFLVFFMQAGFCMVEMGFSRAKNAINIAMKNLLDFSASIVCYLLFGFTIMFGISTTGWVGGGEHFWLSNFSGSSPIWAFFFFQSVFAATCCTIASGAMAERTKFLGYLVYSAIMAGLIYPIFGHWAWGSLGGSLEPGFGGSPGWLENLGFVDFAGSTVVHGIGGACALAGIIVLGPRRDKFTKSGEPRLIPGHSVPLASLGALILWMGWFGFNAGSAGFASAEVGRIVVNTAVSASTGALLAMVLFWFLQGTPSITITINGVLGGLVAATACCHCVTPASALLIGAVAGLISTGGAIFIEHRLKLDDVVGAVPVHLFNGIWGTLAVALFNDAGFEFARVWTQLFGALFICGGAFVTGLVLFKLIDATIGLRADDEEQEDGLDFSEHSANAYPDFRTADR